MAAASPLDRMLASLDDLVSADRSDLRYEIRKLRAIRDWALDHLGVDYREGDRVRIKDDFRVDPATAPGWIHYAEALAPGADATVVAIDFNAVHNYWYAQIILDREWSVAPPLGSGDRLRRWWDGPADETPEGMEPPSAYDQEHYPQGRKHQFALKVTYLEKRS